MVALLPAPRGGPAAPAPTEVPSRPTAVGGRWVGEQYRPKGLPISPKGVHIPEVRPPRRAATLQKCNFTAVILYGGN